MEQDNRADEIKNLARGHAETAIGALVDVVNNALGAKQTAARVMAAKILLERGFGAPERKTSGTMEHTIVDQRQAHFEALKKLARKREALSPPGTPANPELPSTGPERALAGRLTGQPPSVIEDAEYTVVPRRK